MRLYFTAWDRLRFDRSYGAMGGESPVPYTALSRYAADQDIVGDDFDLFLTLFGALDQEWLAWQANKTKPRH